MSSDAEHRADRAIHVSDRESQIDALARGERGFRGLDELVVERLGEAVVLRLQAPAPDTARRVGFDQERRQVEPARLPVRDRLAQIDLVHAADHLVDRPESEQRHQLAHFLGDELEVVLDELRLAVVLRPEHRILGRDAHRTRVQVADAHHDAARHDERRGRKPEFLAAEQRGNHDVAAGLHLAVHLHDDAVAQAVDHEHLLGLGQAELPGHAGVLDARQRRRARAAVVAGNQDDVGVRLGHARGDRADAHFGDELHVNPRVMVGVLQVVDELRQVLDRVDVVVRRRRNQRHARRRMPHLGNPGIDLESGQLTAFARLGPLRHLDLEVAAVDQVLARHAESRGRDLLDRASPPVAVRILPVALRILAAFAAVRLAAEPVHRDRERLVRFLADRSVGHRPGGESLDDGLDRLDLVEGHGGLGPLQLEQPAQRPQTAALVVHGPGVVAVDRVLAASRRVLELEHRLRIEEMEFAVAAPLIFAAGVEVRRAGGARPVRLLMPPAHFLRDDVDADAANP